MLRRRRIRSLAGLIPVLLAATAAHAIVGAQEVPAERSGFVSLQGAWTCTGVMLSSDLALTSARCFSPAELLHPELVGWFMGSQDSEGDPSVPRNPIKEIIVEPGARR